MKQEQIRSLERNVVSLEKALADADSEAKDVRAELVSSEHEVERLQRARKMWKDRAERQAEPAISPPPRKSPRRGSRTAAPSGLPMSPPPSPPSADGRSAPTTASTSRQAAAAASAASRPAQGPAAAVAPVSSGSPSRRTLRPKLPPARRPVATRSSTKPAAPPVVVSTAAAAAAPSPQRSTRKRARTSNPSTSPPDMTVPTATSFVSVSSAAQSPLPPSAAPPPPPSETAAEIRSPSADANLSSATVPTSASSAPSALPTQAAATPGQHLLEPVPSGAASPPVTPAASAPAAPVGIDWYAPTADGDLDAAMQAEKKRVWLQPLHVALEPAPFDAARDAYSVAELGRLSSEDMPTELFRIDRSYAGDMVLFGRGPAGEWQIRDYRQFPVSFHDGPDLEYALGIADSPRTANQGYGSPFFAALLHVFSTSDRVLLDIFTISSDYLPRLLLSDVVLKWAEKYVRRLILTSQFHIRRGGWRAAELTRHLALQQLGSVATIASCSP